MTSAGLGTLKFFALLFLLPGLAGLIGSAMVSTQYLATLPRVPSIEQNRVYPRGIHGTVVYQTPQEDHTLNLLEYSSVAVFAVGLVLGLVYLEQWGSAQQQTAEQDEHVVQHVG